jgi:ABC-type antimicrobial peptide transport system permease subunit
MLLSTLSTAVNLSLLGCSILFSSLLAFPFIITGAQIVSSVIASFAVVMLLSVVASYKLVRTEPAEALRK